MEFSCRKWSFIFGLLFLIQYQIEHVESQTQCSRPIIPYSDATSSTPPLEDGEIVTVTCDTGYSNGYSQVSSSKCEDGTLNPPMPFCYAMCSRPVVPYSDAMSSYPLLHHGSSVTVTCNDGYSNGETRSSISQCNDGILSPSVPYCYAQCDRPVVPNSDAISPEPPLDHGKAVTVVCNPSYSNGQSQISMVVCNHGTLVPSVPTCYADCTPRIIPYSDYFTQKPDVIHSTVITVTCWPSHSMGPYSISTDLTCNDGNLKDENIICHENCPYIGDPSNGEMYIGSDPFYHGEVAGFRCFENFTMVGDQEIFCSEGSWNKDPAQCFAQCTRPVVTNSDARSETPLLDHGDPITVTCDDGYSNGDSRRTTLVCSDGMLQPAQPSCYQEKMEAQDAVGVALGVIGTILGIVATAIAVYELRDKICPKQTGGEQKGSNSNLATSSHAGESEEENRSHGQSFSSSANLV